MDGEKICRKMKNSRVKEQYVIWKGGGVISRSMGDC